MVAMIKSSNLLKSSSQRSSKVMLLDSFCLEVRAARTSWAQSRMTDVGDYNPPTGMEEPAITAMQTTAKAFAQALKQQQLQDATERADAANAIGHNHSLQLGDTVTFFIPPTALEAAKRGRKVKHIAHYKGPAIIVKKHTPTTFRIRYNGSVYDRCLSELRASRSNEQPAITTTGSIL